MVANVSEDASMQEELPPPVEGHIPTAAEMEIKAANGRYYMENVWKICAEFPTSDTYTCRTDLSGLENALYTGVRDIGYELSDESSRFNRVTNCLELAAAWAQVCRDARTQKKMFIVRRTPENSGALLMVQRLEHLRGQVSEFSPLSYLVLVRDDQMLVTRDRVMDQEVTERVLLEFAKAREDCCICGDFLRSRQATVFACGHQAHSSCYEKVANAGHLQCPACRSPVQACVIPIEMQEDGAHHRLVALSKPPAPIVQPPPQRPTVMSDEMFKKQMDNMKDLMSQLDTKESEGSKEVEDAAAVGSEEEDTDGTPGPTSDSVLAAVAPHFPMPKTYNRAIDQGAESRAEVVLSEVS